MPAWLLTNTTYGTWLPGDRRGSVTSVRVPTSDTRIEFDLPGEPYVESIPELRQAAIRQMKGPPIYLDLARAEVLAEQFRETARFRNWTILAIAIMRNHWHIVVAAPGDPSPAKILGDFKAWGTRRLTREFGEPRSQTWWTDGGSKRILKNTQAVANAVNYVLKKQPNPLVVWPAADTPAADAGRLAAKTPAADADRLAAKTPAADAGRLALGDPT
jgi:REP element-mobilizing transposase RayT